MQADNESVWLIFQMQGSTYIDIFYLVIIMLWLGIKT